MVTQNADPLLGKIAIYICNTGYVLSGNPVRQCQKNFTWTGAIPSCTPRGKQSFSLSLSLSFFSISLSLSLHIEILGNTSNEIKNYNLFTNRNNLDFKMSLCFCLFVLMLKAKAMFKACYDLLACQ